MPYPLNRRAEVQLGSFEFDREVVGPLIGLDRAGRRRDEAAPARVDQMTSLPTDVADATEVEFASRHDDLLIFAVEDVAIDVEVFDAQPGDLTSVDEKTVLHLGRVEESYVGERFDVGFDFTCSERAELHLAHFDVGQPDRFSSRNDVALDVHLLAGLLIRIDHEGLHDRRVDHTADDRHHEPERRRQATAAATNWS